MPVCECLSAFAVRTLTERVDVLFRLATDHASDHSRTLLAALEASNRKAWRSLEIALAGESLWTWFDREENKALRREIKAFIDTVEFPELAGRADARAACLRELRDALGKGVLLGRLVAGDLAERAGTFARHADPQALLAAEKAALDDLGAQVALAGYPALGKLLATPADAGRSVVVVAVRFFFRREVERNPELFQGLQFTATEALAEGQAAGFDRLAGLLDEQAERLDAGLAAVAGQVVAEVRAVGDSVKLVHDSVRGVESRVADIQLTVEHATAAAMAAQAAAELHGADTGRKLDDLHGRMAALLDKLDMLDKPVEPKHSLSLRTDRERELVKELLTQVRGLPDEARAARPQLVTDVGKLQLAVGDFAGAGESFAVAAAIAESAPERAEAFHNAYRTKLEQDDFPGALADLRQAVELDTARFAPFPFDKYPPDRILGAGGFGVTFLCRHKLTAAPVAVKSIHDGGLDRDAASVLKEAMTLDQLKHRAIVGLRDCGFADEARRRRPYLVMEFFDGPTLQSHVETNGPVPLADLLPLARTLAGALRAAHDQGVLHRDIKPANVMVNRVATDGGRRWDVRVIDFGLAMPAAALSDRSTARGLTVYGSAIAGTLDYAAPEQLGKLPGVKVGPAADVYGFAKTLCFALFKTTEPTNRHYNQLPPRMADLIGRCLSREPDERPRGFGEVQAELAAIDGDDRSPRPEPKPAAALAEVWGKVTKAVESAVAGASPPPAAPPPARPRSIEAPREERAPEPRQTRAEERRPRRPARERGDEPRGPSSTDRTSHALLAIFLGTWGVHKFVQGCTTSGIIRAVIGVFLCPVTLLVGIVEGIQYFSMSDEEYARTYLRDKKEWF
ncbi:MAG: protein kinase [Gemmataceae bacterium]